MFMIDGSNGSTRRAGVIRSEYNNRQLTFMCMRRKYVRNVCCCAFGNPSAVPAPVMCRAQGLNFRAVSASTHVLLALTALRSTLRPICAAQNRLPRSHALCCTVSVLASTGHQGRCQPPRPLDRAFFLGCAWPSACALPGMCRGYGGKGWNVLCCTHLLCV